MVNWGVFGRKPKQPKKGSGATAESLESKVRQSQVHEVGNGGIAHDYTMRETKPSDAFPTDGATALKPEDYTSPQQPIAAGNVLPFATREKQAMPAGGGGSGGSGGGFSGGGTTTIRGGFPHISRWAAYTLTALLLLAGGGAAAYNTVPAARTFVDTQYQRLLSINRNKLAPTTTTPVTTPPASTAPAISPYRQQALEEIAAITQKEPGLARLLLQTDWLGKGISQVEAEFVNKIRKYIADENYATGTINHNDGSFTNVLVLSTDKDKRDEVLTKTQQYLPQVSQLLKIEYKRPLLVVDVFNGGGGADFRGVNITSPEDLEHELVHTIYEFSGSADVPLAQVPPWVVEGVPEFVRRYLKGGDALVEIARKNLSNPSRGLIDPLFDISLNPGSHMGIYEGGLLFLAEYKNLVGYDNFWKALSHVHDVRVANGVIPRKVILNKDLENPTDEVKDIVRQQHEELGAILEQHVPSDKLPQFRQLYQSRIYGVQETKP